MLMDQMLSMRGNTKSRMTPGFWPEQLEEWWYHFLVGMETVVLGMGVARFEEENQ